MDNLPVRIYIDFMGLGNSLYFRSIGFDFTCNIGDVTVIKSPVHYHDFFSGKNIPVP